MGQNNKIGTQVGPSRSMPVNPAPVVLPPQPGLGGIARGVQTQRMGGPLPSRPVGQGLIPIEMLQRIALLQQMQGPDLSQPAEEQ